MFATLTPSETGKVLYMKLFPESIDDHDWGVFEDKYRELYATLPVFTLVIDATNAWVYRRKWVKKFIDLFNELYDETDKRNYIVVVQNRYIRVLIRMISNPDIVQFVETLEQLDLET